MTIPGFIGGGTARARRRSSRPLIIFLFMIVYNVSVLQGMGRIFEGLMDLPYMRAVLISGLIILFYVVLGGYMAVVWTSFIQAWVMIVALILLMFTTFDAVGGLGAGMEKLAAIGPGPVDTPGVWGWDGAHLASALVVSLGVWGMPQMIIRFYTHQGHEDVSGSGP